MFGCLFNHDWVTQKIWLSYDVSFGQPGYLHTGFYDVCKKCGKKKQDYLDGDLTK
jgi:hypothetical protein